MPSNGNCLYRHRRRRVGDDTQCTPSSSFVRSGSMSRLESRGGVMVTQNRIVSLVNSTIRPVLFMIHLVCSPSTVSPICRQSHTSASQFMPMALTLNARPSPQLASHPMKTGKQEHVALHLHEGGFGLGTPPPCATVCGQRYKERQHGDNHARHWCVGFQRVDDVPQ